MMQDFPRLCGPDDKVGVTQVERWISKTSVKNNLADAVTKNPPECALTCEADLYSCNVRLLQKLGFLKPVETVKTETVQFDSALGREHDNRGLPVPTSTNQMRCPSWV